MVQMVRNATEPNGRDRFSCSAAVWALLLELGQAFGWQPKGTTYLARANLKVVTLAASPARHDYQPGDALDHKQIDADDAVAWARALEAAKQSAQFTSMIEEYWTRHTPDGDPQIRTLQTLHSLVYEFTEFAFGGDFTFAKSSLFATGV